MCGISGIAGQGWKSEQIERMLASQDHRGPDDNGLYIDPQCRVALAHNRLSIIDLSAAGHQPMRNHEGNKWVIFNGEIYNYRELRTELCHYPYRSHSDTEVILAAYEQWGEECLNHFIGMFAFAIWDESRQMLFAARDRFGVKPFYYCDPGPEGCFFFASEIKSLHSAGIPRVLDPLAWSTYLTYGLYDHWERTFWEDIRSLPPGHALRWQQSEPLAIWKWYDLAERVGSQEDNRTEEEVGTAYRTLLEDCIRLRFRADVPVGINLSGGLDSALLLGLVHTVEGPESNVNTFTFITGDQRYDELPWVRQMLDHTQHPHHLCLITSSEVPELVAKVQRQQDEPFGGFPTLAYSKVFLRARELGILVLLDGQGIDEQWGGYDYYEKALTQDPCETTAATTCFVQGSVSAPVKPECLIPEFRALAQHSIPPSPFTDGLRALQFRDTRFTKIPRTLRFNDRISMLHSTELREPFLDHRLFELALSQPANLKIRGGTRKWLVRRVARDLLPSRLVEAPKRPVQTPQREWLRGPLRGWANDCIESVLEVLGGAWLDPGAVRSQWKWFQNETNDNSFFVWQWISLAQVLANVG